MSSLTFADLPRDMNFLAFSGFAYFTDFQTSLNRTAVHDLDSVRKMGKEQCSLSWKFLQKKFPEKKTYFLRRFCFLSAYTVGRPKCVS